MEFLWLLAPTQKSYQSCFSNFKSFDLLHRESFPVSYTFLKMCFFKLLHKQCYKEKKCKVKNKSKVLHSNISIVFIFPYSLSVPEYMTWSLRLDLVNVQFYKPDVPANRLFMGIKELLLSTGTGKLESVTNSALIYKTPNFPCLYLHF